MRTGNQLVLFFHLRAMGNVCNQLRVHSLGDPWEDLTFMRGAVIPAHQLFTFFPTDYSAFLFLPGFGFQSRARI
jgi:hypothetical protein